MTWILTLGDIAYQIAGMAWKIAWGLVLGFGISGFTQAFVSQRAVAGHLGRSSWRAVLLASAFGAASSSCSYAAAAMSKTLFQKGAHLVAATAFLVASTNLVIEIGLVIWVLLGWRFVAAELVGGVLLIAVATVILTRLVPGRLSEAARAHLQAQGAGSHEHVAPEGLPWRRLTTREGLEAAARHFADDWAMTGKDIALGLVIAGSLAALVPPGWWETLFLAGSGSGHPGLWISLENAVAGPLIAILSFVCSVGNIPLAAVLWAGGSSFGGVIAFILADLVTIPMVLVYRRYYGWKPALAYAVVLFAAIVISALVVDGLFRGTGLAPDPGRHVAAMVEATFALDYTAILNAVFLPLGTIFFWLGRRARGGREAPSRSV